MKCEEFVKSSEGNCIHLTDKYICSKPHRYKCYESYHKSNNSSKNETEQNKHYSYSTITAYMKCPRIIFFKKSGFELPEEDIKNMVAGSIFADIRARIEIGVKWNLEYWYKKYENNPEFLIEIAKVEAVLSKYEKLINDGILPKLSVREQEVMLRDVFDFKYPIVGYADGLTEDRKVLYEWKYSTSESLYNILSISKQIAIYLLLEPKIKEVNICVAKKPMNKVGKNESFEDFRNRLMNSVSAENFKVVTYRRNIFDLNYEYRNIISVIERIEKDNDYYPNTTSCNFCKFRDFCEVHPYLKECGYQCKYNCKELTFIRR